MLRCTTVYTYGAGILAFVTFFYASLASGQTCHATPSPLKAGDLIRATCSEPMAHARMNGKTIPMFKQSDGGYLGLLPVPVLQAAGVYKVEFLKSDGGIATSVNVVVRDPHFPSQNVVLSKALTDLHSTPADIEALTKFRSLVTETRFWAEPFSPPVTGCITSPFGVKRLHNGKSTGDYHAGIDQRAAAGTPIRAMTAGVVRLAQPITVSGNTVGIDHGQGFETMYLHMSKLATTAGTHVEKGDIIGYVGSTGRSTGPHLHWTIYANGLATNPGQWFKFPVCGIGPKKPSKKKPQSVPMSRDTTR